MQQDTLQHVQTLSPPSSEAESQAAVSEPTAVPQGHVRHKAFTDTLARPTLPHELLPLPGNEPLTCLPEICQTDPWADGLVKIQKSELAEQLDSTSGMHFSETFVQPSGIAGDPVPYRFKNDNFVTITLLLSFFLVVWVISRSRHFLRDQMKEFFHRPSVRGNLFSEHVETAIRGQVFLIFQTCFVIGLLFFDFTQEKQIEVFNQVSPYKILSVSVGISSLYYILKTILYNFVNSVFFSREQRTQWNQTYLLSVLALSLALLPVALLVIYFDMSFANMVKAFICILVVDKSLLMYKCYRTFFNYTFGWVHLFLYFCTLEIMPLLILLRIMVYANSFLLTIN